jgi:hypothetical protein
MQKYTRLGSGSLHARLKLFAYYIQRVCVSRRLRRAATYATIAVLGRLHGQTGRAHRPGAATAAALCEQGYLRLGKLLSERQCDEMLAWLRPRGLVAARGNGQTFTADQIPAGTLMGDYPLDSVVNCPHVMELANRPDIIALARDYLGYTPTITLMGLRCSFPSTGRDADVQGFHRDSEPGCIKLMVYLTEVDLLSGPHSYVPGTHHDRMPLRLQRYADHDIERDHGGSVTITGPAGTGFVIDTKGIHKGTPPSKGRRLVLVIQYSLLPCLIYDYAPVAYRGGRRFDAYINRLMIAGGGTSGTAVQAACRG